MLTSPLYVQKSFGETRCNGHAGEREVSAQYTQADRKESLRSQSCEGQKALGKSDALFSSEQGNLIRSSETLIRRIWEDLFLKVMRITCSIRQDQTWRSKNFMSNSLNKCIGEIQRQTEKQRLALLDAQCGFVESRREQVRLQEELFSVKEKVLRNTQIRTMHEMGEIQRAQDLRADEVSVQKLRENQETIQQLTTQLQQVQEQMNSVNDFGDFQDVESKSSGRLSYVSSQHAMIPSSRSMLSRDKRLLLDTWNQSGLKANVFGNQFSTFDSSQKPPQGNSLVHTAKRTWNYRRTTRSDSRESKYRNCNSTDSLIHNRF